MRHPPPLPPEEPADRGKKRGGDMNHTTYSCQHSVEPSCIESVLVSVLRCVYTAYKLFKKVQYSLEK